MTLVFPARLFRHLAAGLESRDNRPWVTTMVIPSEVALKHHCYSLLEMMAVMWVSLCTASCYSLLSLYDIIIQYNMTFHSKKYLRMWSFAKKKVFHKTLWCTLFTSKDLEWEGVGSDGWQNAGWAKRIQVWKGMFEQIYAVAQPVRRLCLPSIVPIWLWNIIFALKPSHHLF